MEFAYLEVLEATKRLIAVAKKDTDQSRYAANFLLAWWNARSCGGFDFTDLWVVDEIIADDMITIFTYNSRVRCSADNLSLNSEFETLVSDWRPHLIDTNLT